MNEDIIIWCSIHIVVKYECYNYFLTGGNTKMNYKKLVSLLAVSTLALSACGTADDAEETPTDETEEVETDTTEDAADSEETPSSEELMQRAQEESGDAFPEYGLYVTGAWTQEGRVVQHAPGEAATIPVSVISDHEEYNVYLLEDGVVTEVVSNEPEVELVVDAPSADVEYVVGVSPEALGEVGTELSEEDFERSEKVVFEEAEPAAEGEEE